MLQTTKVIAYQKC